MLRDWNYPNILYHVYLFTVPSRVNDDPNFIFKYIYKLGKSIKVLSSSSIIEFLVSSGILKRRDSDPGRWGLPECGAVVSWRVPQVGAGGTDGQVWGVQPSWLPWGLQEQHREESQVWEKLPVFIHIYVITAPWFISTVRRSSLLFYLATLIKIRNYLIFY